MAESIVRLAVIGVGGIWRGAHIKNLAALGGNRIVAVCDIHEGRLNDAAKATGGQPFADMEDLFGRGPEFDAVIACTPPTVRKQVVEGAARRGVPALVEKPPEFRLEDAMEIVRIVQQTGSPVAVGFMYRYLPAVDRLKQLIAGKTINLVQSSFYCPAATEWNLPGWFYLKDRSGGHVLDQAIHVMDLLRFVAGDIVQVHTLGNNLICPKSETFTIEDSSSTNLRFASGASGGHIHSWSHHEFTGFVTVVGKDFRLTLHLDRHLSGFVGEQKIDETFPAPPEGCSHHYDEMKTFLDAIRRKDFAAMRSPYADAAKSLATVMAMNRSIEVGRPVEVG